MKEKYLSIEFLEDNGLLFEINRKVLHPLGLALCFVCKVDELGNEVTNEIQVWDCRKDEEGIVFAAETYEDGEKKFCQYMREFGKKGIKKRYKKLGYITQGEGE